MANITIKVSDLSRQQGEEADFGRLIVRQYPGLAAPVQLDVLPDELKGLEPMGDLVQLEYYEPGSETPQMLMIARKDFDQLAKSSTMAEVLSKARGLRGRRATT